MKRNLFILSLMLSVLVLVGCPVVVGPTTPTIKVTPPSVTLEKNKSQIFKAEMSDGTSATFGWLVLPGNGTLSSTTTPSVNYTAPATAGNYKITVDSSTASVATTVNIKVVDLVSVVVTPSAVTVAPGDTVTLNASLDSAKDSSFTWDSTGGTLSASAGKTVTFTAPNTLGISEVIVKSPDASRDGTANITVAPVQTANAQPETPILSGASIQAGQRQTYVIDLPSSIFDGGQDLVYFELGTSSDIKLSVFDANRDLIAVSNDPRFFTADGATTNIIEPQVIKPVTCRGSCVILEKQTGRFYIELESDINASYDLFAYSDPNGDKSEPNDESQCKSTANDFFALETLGDVDCFNSDAAYNKVTITTFADGAASAADDSTALEVEAKVFDRTSNELLATLKAGPGADSDSLTISGPAKQFKIVVRSSDGRAGPSANSRYGITPSF
jgi:plastocyanin